MRKVPLHVDPEHLVESLQGHLRGGRTPCGPAVVDDHVKAPEGLLGRHHDLLDTLGVCDVALDGDRPAALRPYLALYFFEGFDLARAQHDGGPGVGEGFGHVAAEAAPAARYDGSLPVEPEEIQSVQYTP